jgi:phasin
MNKHEPARRFADKSTKTARETVERGASSVEDATRGAEKSFSSSLAGMRELNIKLLDMAHANAEAVFELANEMVSAEAPSDLATIWSAHARRQFEMMTKQTRELTELGQKLAGRSTEPLKRGINDAFRRGTT